jgi:hypothetical protein
MKEKLQSEIARLNRWILRTEDPEVLAIYEDMLRVREIQLQQTILN